MRHTLHSSQYPVRKIFWVTFRCLHNTPSSNLGHVMVHPVPTHYLWIEHRKSVPKHETLTYGVQSGNNECRYLLSHVLYLILLTVNYTRCSFMEKKVKTLFSKSHARITLCQIVNCTSNKIKVYIQSKYQPCCFNEGKNSHGKKHLNIEQNICHNRKCLSF